MPWYLATLPLTVRLSDGASPQEVLVTLRFQAEDAAAAERIAEHLAAPLTALPGVTPTRPFSLRESRFPA